MKYNLTNKTFGNLIVIKMTDDIVKKGQQRKYICQCQCKNNTIIIVKTNDLISGRKDNCGCLTKIKQRNAKKKYNNYNLDGEFGVGYTLKGEEFYFDLEDYDKINNYCWNFHKNRSLAYIEARGENKKNIKLHRLIMNVTDRNILIDHISHNTLDNRKSNLRLCNNSQNSKNRIKLKRNLTGINGVSLRKDTGKYRVRLGVNGKEINIGQYESLDNAIIAREDAEQKYYGEFAPKKHLFENAK